MAPLCVLALLLVGAGASGEAQQEAALAAEDECAAGLEQNCALSALQRRGSTQERSQDRRAAAALTTAGTADEAGEADLTARENVTWSPSCSSLGCSAAYSRYRACQCNAHCKRYGNCCGDYDAKCAQHQPAPGGGSASCRAYPRCAGLGSGNCCPTPTGMYLGCCPDSVVPHATAPPPEIVGGRKMMTLYHQTSPQICSLIMAQGFKLGSGGWCGGAIYFALSPQATRTKAITPHSGVGCMIEAKVDVGNVKKYPCCRYCGGHQDQHIPWTEHSLKAKGYDAIEINPGDGPEIVVYNKNRIQSMRVVPFRNEWMPHLMHYRE